MSGDAAESGTRSQQDSPGTVSVTRAENAQLSIDTGVIQADFLQGESVDVRVIQDDTFMMLLHGVDYPDDDKAVIGQKITPDQAREIAGGLNRAANQAEKAIEQAKDYDPTEDRAGLVERIVRSVMPS